MMGGIADYSGSLVLQLPTRLACHVALQAQPVTGHRLWRHMLARQGGSPHPVLRIVSLNADKTNRCAAATRIWGYTHLLCILVLLSSMYVSRPRLSWSETPPDLAGYSIAKRQPVPWPPASVCFCTVWSLR